MCLFFANLESILKTMLIIVEVPAVLVEFQLLIQYKHCDLVHKESIKICFKYVPSMFS